MLQTIAPTMNAQPALQFGVMGCQLTTAQRPTDLFTLHIHTSQIFIRETQGDATPGEAAAANLQTSRPQKRLIRRVLIGMQTLVGIQTRVGFPVCLLYTSPSPRDLSTSRMPSSA